MEDLGSFGAEKLGEFYELVGIRRNPREELLKLNKSGRLSYIQEPVQVELRKNGSDITVYYRFIPKAENYKPKMLKEFNKTRNKILGFVKS